MRSTTALLVLGSFLLAGASCEKRPDPPVSVIVKVPVPTPCTVPEPQCNAPEYDFAKKDQPGDAKIRLMRAETASQSDCLRQYRDALRACRTP